MIGRAAKSAEQPTDIRTWGARVLAVVLLMQLIPSVLFALPQANEPPEDAPEVDVRPRPGTWHFDLPISLDLQDNDVIDRREIASWAIGSAELLNLMLKKTVLTADLASLTVGERLGLAALVAVPQYVVGVPIATAAHEYGHFRAHSLAGMTEPEFIDRTDPDIRIAARPHTAFWAMLRQTVVFDASYYAGQSVRAFDGFWEDPSHFENWVLHFIQVNADGLNQSQFNTAVISRKVLDSRASVLDLGPYLANVLDTVLYPLVPYGDPVGYRNLIRSQGVEVGLDEIKWKAQAPKLLSNSMLSLGMGVVDFVRSGDPFVEPIHFTVGEWRLYWPEFRSYLTTRGPTIQGEIRLGIDRSKYAIGFERAMGSGSWEFSGGWEAILSDRLLLDARAVLAPRSGGWWIEATPSVAGTGYTIGLYLAAGRGYTFRREIVGNVADWVGGGEFNIGLDFRLFLSG